MKGAIHLVVGGEPAKVRGTGRRKMTAKVRGTKNRKWAIHRKPVLTNLRIVSNRAIRQLGAK